MKTLIKKYLFQIVIIGTLLTLVLSNWITKCSENHSVRVHEMVTDNNTIKAAIDSVNMLRDSVEKVKIDSALKVSSTKITTLQNKVTNGKAETNRLKAENKALLDSIDNNPTIDNFQKVVIKQQEIITEQDATIIDLDCENKEYSKSVFLLTQKVGIVMDENEILKSANTRLNNSIEVFEKERIKAEKRNKFKIAIRNVVIIAETALLIVNSR